MAHTTSFNFDEDITCFEIWHGNLLECDRSSLRLEDADLVFLWKATHVVCLAMYEASRSL